MFCVLIEIYRAVINKLMFEERYPCATMNQSERFDGFVACIFLLYIGYGTVQEIQAILIM